MTGDVPRAVAAPSRWRASPARLARLVVGLFVFGAGDALIVRGQLGNSPWTVLAQGAAERVHSSIGLITVVVSVLVLLAWLPLHQRPGLGTVANALLVGVAIDLTLSLVSEAHRPFAGRLALVLAGIALVAVGSALYLGVRLGPGPRDGLMTGLSRRTGRSLRAMRFAIEGSALLAGIALGGTAGLGTVLFAVLIGPAVQAALLFARAPAGEL